MVLLENADIKDAAAIHHLQVDSFQPLLEKYQDFDTKPANEGVERIVERFQQSFPTYYFIVLDEVRIGAIRLVHWKDKDRARISPIFILPQYPLQLPGHLLPPFDHGATRGGPRRRVCHDTSPHQRDFRACVPEAGVSTLMEKPPGINLKERQGLRDAATRSGAQGMVGWNHRIEPLIDGAALSRGSRVGGMSILTTAYGLNTIF